jgi:hypothetical protein
VSSLITAGFTVTYLLDIAYINLAPVSICSLYFKGSIIGMSLNITLTHLSSNLPTLKYPCIASLLCSNDLARTRCKGIVSDDL